MSETRRLLCKFTHNTSIMVEGERFWIVGSEVGDWFDFSSYQQAPDPIAAAENLDEGRVHLMTERGAIFEVTADPQTTFRISKLRD